MITRVAMRYSANNVPRSTAGRVPSRRSVASLGKFRRQLSRDGYAERAVAIRQPGQAMTGLFSPGP